MNFLLNVEYSPNTIKDNEKNIYNFESSIIKLLKRVILKNTKMDYQLMFKRFYVYIWCFLIINELIVK